ncbi:MAG: DUF47 family protein [Bacillota bacterium]|nr:DUF47 family protein [Bacillota bacterium]
MAIKKDYYFDSFVNMADYCCRASELLNSIIVNFKPDDLKNKMKEMHDIEHEADTVRHSMIQKLSREFITPIEREDIVGMADAIDSVTDTIEDVLMRLYMFNISSVRKHALNMSEIITKCCIALKEALAEFHNYKKFQDLHDLIILVNNLEDDGDSLFIEATRDLYVNCKDSIEILALDEIFHYLEICCDACEDVADIIESIMLKNS